MQFGRSINALLVALVALAASGCHAQYFYGGGYGYGLRGYGGYYGGGYGYPSYGVAYPYYGGYGVYGKHRKLLDTMPAPGPEAQMEPPDVSLCPLDTEADPEFKAALTELAANCTAEEARGGDQAEFCSACVVPGQVALAKAAYAFTKKQEAELGGDRDAIRAAIKPLLSEEGERACGKKVVDFLADAGVPADEAFLRKASKCGAGFDERKQCILDAKEDERIGEIASSCATVVTAADAADAASVKSYCQECYWPLLGFTIGAVMRDSPTTAPSELKCALKEVGELYEGPDAEPTEEAEEATRRFADALYRDTAYMHCASNAVAAVKIAADTEPFGAANVRELIPQCWQGENRPVQGGGANEMLDSVTEEELAALTCPAKPSK